MKIYSEKTRQFYNTVKECEVAEKEFEQKEIQKKKELEELKKKQEELKITRGERAKELEEAKNKYFELQKQFIKDFGTYHTNITTFEPFELINDFFRFI